ncbi:helix-turn-helix domain-containing protein [Pseudomonas sp. Snoq117.2]|uniref:helix-turn-helix domain-containing protein n=1 Tax=Pseudomonas sp. Snoq117.2 TaxID=1500302 RepID=UPI0008ADF5D8|nr:helix-turn-helix domain-containing protein [Pseudomonas sp. Snoq117.2]SEP41288.1 hypothetical protein SAMN02787149_110103 [Pseudomonas sp. Snoq117.2]
MSQAAQELRNQGYSLREIGRMLKLHPSWVCRHTVPPAANDSSVESEDIAPPAIQPSQMEAASAALRPLLVIYRGIPKTLGEVCDFYDVDPTFVVAQCLRGIPLEEAVDNLVIDPY